MQAYPNNKYLIAHNYPHKISEIQHSCFHFWPLSMSPTPHLSWIHSNFHFHFYSIYNRFTTASAAAQMDRAPPQAGEQPLKRSSAASSAMASSTSGHMGKHRMLAAISFLNQEIQIMQALNLFTFFSVVGAICFPNSLTLKSLLIYLF